MFRRISCSDTCFKELFHIVLYVYVCMLVRRAWDTHSESVASSADVDRIGSDLLSMDLLAHACNNIHANCKQTNNLAVGHVLAWEHI